MLSKRDAGQHLAGTGFRLKTCLASLAVALVFAVMVSCGAGQQPAKSTPSPEEKAYLKNIQVSPGSVEAARNFLGHTVTTVHADVTNKGKKTVLYLELNLTFSDIEGNSIKQAKAYPIRGDTLPLKPGETRPFQVSFDQVPALWNQAPPKMTPVRVVLAGE